MTHNKKTQKVLAYVCLVGSLFLLHALSKSAQRIPTTLMPTKAGACKVEIKGLVAWPGVYGFTPPPTLAALIKTAGGLTKDLSFDCATISKQIPCFKSITVYNTSSNDGAILESEIDSFHKITLGIKLDLNRESPQGLVAIPGIGIKTARNIVALRSKMGGFHSLDELSRAPGIGKKLIHRISKYVSLSPCFHQRSDCL